MSAADLARLPLDVPLTPEQVLILKQVGELMVSRGLYSVRVGGLGDTVTGYFFQGDGRLSQWHTEQVTSDGARLRGLAVQHPDLGEIHWTGVEDPS